MKHPTTSQTRKRARTPAKRKTAPPVRLNKKFWTFARLLMPDDLPKTSVHLRVDSDVLGWFKSQGKGHLTRMNAVLRAYYEANRKDS